MSKGFIIGVLVILLGLMAVVRAKQQQSVKPDEDQQTQSQTQQKPPAQAPPSKAGPPVAGVPPKAPAGAAARPPVPAGTAPNKAPKVPAGGMDISSKWNEHRKPGEAGIEQLEKQSDSSGSVPSPVAKSAGK